MRLKELKDFNVSHTAECLLDAICGESGGVDTVEGLS